MKTYKIIVKNENRWIIKDRGLSSATAYSRLPYYEDIYGVGNEKVARENRNVKQVKDMR